jgi:flagellar L-ring protein precursor FlgH
MNRISTISRLLAAILALGLGGCAMNAVQIQGPTTAVPQPVAADAPVTGGIFQHASYRPLFEDRRARYVGDTILIAINERTSASSATNNNASRSASVNVAAPKINAGPVRGLQGTEMQASASSKMEDKDQARNDNLFSGTVTATVTAVLPNGNLVVAGEKQIGVNGEVDTLRFSGVVNPLTIQPGNTVSSTQVADARLEAISRSSVDPARVAGFLGRFFLSFMPFR